MTGAAYAALPFGPQLNNYDHLVTSIAKSDPREAEPLTDYEERILVRIARTLPGDRTVFDAAHKEKAYTTKKTGEPIPYTEADTIAAV